MQTWPRSSVESYPDRTQTRHNSNPDNGEETHRDPVAHAMPTDSDLAVVVDAWKDLPIGVKVAILHLVIEARS